MSVQQIVVYIVAALGIIGLGYYTARTVMTKKKKVKIIQTETGEATPQTTTEPAMARVYDNLLDKPYNTTLPGTTLDSIITKYGFLGRQWDKDGTLLYAFVKVAAGDYKPVEYFLTDSRDYPPTKVHKAITLPGKVIPITHNTTKHQSAMEKYGWLIPWTIGIASIMFMIVSQRAR